MAKEAAGDVEHMELMRKVCGFGITYTVVEYSATDSLLANKI